MSWIPHSCNKQYAHGGRAAMLNSIQSAMSDCRHFLIWRRSHDCAHTLLVVWRVRHGYNTEHSIIVSLTSGALSHYGSLPFSQTLLYFCLSTLYSPAPFLLSTEYASMPAKMNRIPQDVGGEAGGLTRFYTGLMSLEPQTACSRATDWFQYTSRDWSDFSHVHTSYSARVRQQVSVPKPVEIKRWKYHRCSLSVCLDRCDVLQQFFPLCHF